MLRCVASIGMTISTGTTLSAAVDLQGVEVTPTQIILRWIAPSAGACTFEVSESSTYAPLVHDVDASLFTGANSDTRTGCITADRQRTCPVGKRSADVALDGKRYSRSLEQGRPHYYRVTCGGDIATGMTYTAVHPYGNTYRDTMPSDGVGGYAFPSVNWQDASQELIDQQTGVRIKRVTLPDKTGVRQTNEVFQTAVGSGWTNPGNALTDDTADATFSGAGSDPLFLRKDGWNNWWSTLGGRYGITGNDPNKFDFRVNAWCSGGTCGAATDEDKKVLLCLSIDHGQSCASPEIEHILPTVATETPFLNFWKIGDSLLQRQNVGTRTGTVDTAGTAVTWASGDFFSLPWAGGRITINSVEYTIASMDSEKAITLSTSAGTQSGVAYAGQNFGLLIRKKTASTDEISVRFSEFDLEAGSSAAPYAAGSQRRCGMFAVNDAGGNAGYHCLFFTAGGSQGMWWIDATTGEANYLGQFYSGTLGGADGWANQHCGKSAAMISDTEPNVFYCVVVDNSGTIAVLHMTYTGDNSDVGWQLKTDALQDVTVTNITPQSTGNNLDALIATFTAGYTLPYDGALFDCDGDAIVSGRIMLKCLRGNLDSLGWTVLFDPGNGGIVGSGGTGAIITASNTFSGEGGPATARWSGWHSQKSQGDFVVVTGAQLSSGNCPAGNAGCGPYESDLSVSMTTGTVACPANPWNDPDCTDITVDGEPCDATRAGDEPSNCPTSGRTTEHYLQDVAVGDQLRIDSEDMRIIVKGAATSWTVARGINSTTKAAHTSGVKVRMRSGSLSTGGSNVVFNYVTDPDGSEQVLDIGAHQDFAFNFKVNSTFGSALCGDGFVDNWCYGVQSGGFLGMANTISHGTASSGRFENINGFGNPNFINSHVDVEFNDRWFVDGRAIDHSFVSSGFTPTVTNVTGDLYQTTHTVENRKQLPLDAWCGRDHVLVDISSPTTGNIIGGTSTDAYKSCVSEAANECRTGAVAGDIWFNCPQLTDLACNQNAQQSSNIRTTPCLNQLASVAHTIAQGEMDHQDIDGHRSRVVTKALARYFYQSRFWNAGQMADTDIILFDVQYLDGQRADVVGTLLPRDSFAHRNRTQFGGLRLKLPVGSSATTQVRFGYHEHGAPTDFYCTTRADPCHAIGDPYTWESEGPGSIDCSSGCEIEIPAIPGRVVYYQIDGGGLQAAAVN